MIYVPIAGRLGSSDDDDGSPPDGRWIIDKIRPRPNEAIAPELDDSCSFESVDFYTQINHFRLVFLWIFSSAWKSPRCKITKKQNKKLNVFLPPMKPKIGRGPMLWEFFYRNHRRALKCHFRRYSNDRAIFGRLSSDCSFCLLIFTFFWKRIQFAHWFFFVFNVFC